MPKLSSALSSTPYCWFFFFLIVCASFSSAQTLEERKYELARSYEESGDYRNASRMYQELYVGNKKSDDYFDGVARTLMALEQYSALNDLTEERIAFAQTPDVYNLSAQLSWKLGKKDIAEQRWNTSASLCRNNLDCLRKIALSQVSLRLFEKAAATYLLARQQSGHSDMYADELSQLYSAMGNIEKGTEEVLRLYEATKNYNVAQGRLAALMTTPSAEVHIGRILKNIASSDPSALYLLQWFYRETKQFAKAMETTMEIDRKNNSPGRELLSFGRTADKEGEYATALKAFSEIMSFGKSNAYFLPALFGYTTALENQMQEKKDYSEEEVKSIINKYKAIIDEFDQPLISSECQYRIGLLTYSLLHNSNQAIVELTAAVDNYPITSTAVKKAVLLLGDIYIETDKLEYARTVYKKLLSLPRRNNADEYDKADFSIAMIDYYQGKIDSAKEQFGRLAARTESNIANDALERILILEDNVDYPDCLRQFANAELHEKQLRWNTAAESYNNIGTQCKKADLSELSKLRVALMAFRQKKYEESIVTLRNFIVEYPESIFSDRVYLHLADSFAYIGNKDSALEYYTALLAKFPRSLFLQQVREKIRLLRGA